MKITVQELIEKLQGFKPDSAIALKDVDDEDFYSNFGNSTQSFRLIS